MLVGWRIWLSTDFGYGVGTNRTHSLGRTPIARLGAAEAEANAESLDLATKPVISLLLRDRMVQRTVHSRYMLYCRIEMQRYAREALYTS